VSLVARSNSSTFLIYSLYSRNQALLLYSIASRSRRCFSWRARLLMAGSCLLMPCFFNASRCFCAAASCSGLSFGRAISILSSIQWRLYYFGWVTSWSTNPPPPAAAAPHRGVTTWMPFRKKMMKKKKIISRSFVSPAVSSNVVCQTVLSGWDAVTWSRAASDKFTVTVAGHSRASSDCDVTLTLHHCVVASATHSHSPRL